jgi:CHAD domain-containing protein
MAKAKQILGLDYDGPASDGMRQVLLVRIDEMCSLGEQAVDWSDPEGVHNMRVASRRLRGAIRDFLPYLNARPLRSSLRELRKLARILGKVRDYDVTIARLMKTAAKAPPELSAGIRRIAEFRETELDEYRLKLTPWVQSDSLDRLQSRFASALTKALKPGQDKTELPTNGAKSVTYRDVGRGAILNRLVKFEELSQSLYRPLKVKPIHSMRIAAKHLRYALELFEGCWGVSTAALAQQAAAVQSALGDLHDCDVMIEDFGGAATHDRPGLEFDHKGTSIWLMTHFLQQRGKYLKKALQLWDKWEKESSGQAIRNAIGTASLN